MRDEVRFENGVALVGHSLDRAGYDPGEEGILTLYWRPERDLTQDFTAFVHLLDLKGARQAGADEVPLRWLFSPRQWMSGEYVREERRISIPPDAAPGPYSMRVGLYEPAYPEANGRPIRPLNRATVDSLVGVEIGKVRVKAVAVPTAQTRRVGYSFGRELELVGYEATRAPAEASLSVALYWRAMGPIKTSYTVSVQALDEDGRLHGQHDGQPGGGLNPTSSWTADETVKDTHTIGHVPDVQHLRLAIVVYSLSDMRRLPAYASDDRPLGDSVLIEDLR